MTDNQARVPHGVNFLQMKQIPLSQGFFAIVDDCDFEDLAKHKWTTKKDHNKVYAYRTIRLCNGKRTSVLMHRQILGIDSPIDYCDHRDGNGLNNQRENLRLCSNSENQCNTSIRSDNTTGYKGVSFNRRNQKYRARVKHNGKIVYCKYFLCPIEAAKAYNEAAIVYHGDFARLNFL